MFVEKKNRTTNDLLHITEYVNIIVLRTQQIEDGSNTFVDYNNKLDNPIDIAVYEIETRNCPLNIVRKLPNGMKESWSPNEMVLPPNIQKSDIIKSMLAKYKDKKML